MKKWSLWYFNTNLNHFPHHRMFAFLFIKSCFLTSIFFWAFESLTWLNSYERWTLVQTLWTCKIRISKWQKSDSLNPAKTLKITIWSNLKYIWKYMFWIAILTKVFKFCVWNRNNDSHLFTYVCQKVQKKT